MIIELPIEVLITVVVFLVFFFWGIWNILSRRRSLKKYSKLNDGNKKKGGNQRVRELTRRDGIFGSQEQLPARSTEPREQPLLPKTNVDNDREDSNSSRKTSRRTGNLFKRITRRK